MKIILMQDMEKLGQAGDVVEVRDGYGRNFLIPNKKATPATPKNLKIAEALKKKRELASAKKKEAAQALADKITNSSSTIMMAAGEEDKLFGSVTADIIAKSLESNGFDIDKKDIILEEPIKKLGVYHVEVKLDYGIRAKLKVGVVKE
jgi:large subunit ribosomal protein L9